MNGTICILSDNRAANPDRFGCEHGLSVLVRTPSAKILMDTGASGLFAANAALMGIDLSDVDFVFLSHGHSDHVGGLKTFLELNSKAKVIVSPKAVSDRFYSERGGLHSISSDWPLAQMQGRTLSVTDTMTLADGMHVIARIPQRHPLPLGNRLLSVRREGGQVPDDFSHEMALYVDGLLYTGCAHNGLENMLEACPWPVDTVIGGFHLLDSDGVNSFESEDQLIALAERLVSRYPQVSFLTGHCTGNGAFRVLQSVLGSRLQQFACGMQMPKRRRGDWKTEPMPERHVTFVLDRVFSEAEMAALRCGHVPQAMEDKWFWYMEGPTLRAHRSWTGHCIYQIDFKEDGRHVVTANRDPEQYRCTSIDEDIESLNNLLDWWTQVPYDHYNEWLSETYDTLKKAGKA